MGEQASISMLDSSIRREPLLEIKRAVAQLGPDMGAERLRVPEGGVDGKVILEGDFALPASSRRSRNRLGPLQ
jgi:hypothetical protein